MRDKTRLLDGQRELITHYIRKRARTIEDAEDLVQNAFLKASRSFESFRFDCPFSQWMLRIAANELKNYYARDLGRRPDSLDAFDWEKYGESQQFSDEPGPYEMADGRNVAQKLLAVAREVCRDEEFNVLMMVYQEESFEEIASLLEMKSATVRSHFLRARGRLLSHLMKYEPDLLGGREAIRAAEAVAELDDTEANALQRQDGGEAFRSACLKLAKYLPLPLLILSVGETLWKTI